MTKRAERMQSIQPFHVMALLARARDRSAVPVSYADVWEFWLRNDGLRSQVDVVTVRWPSGKVQEFRDVAADHHYVIDEEGGLRAVPSPPALPTAESPDD